jgi:hypothetical protein
MYFLVEEHSLWKLKAPIHQVLYIAALYPLRLSTTSK